MRLLKSQSVLRIANSYFIDSPQPANLSYLWNFGSLLGLCLILQLLTGIFLAMHYVANTDLAFDSVEHTACFIFIYLMCAYLLFKVNIFKNRVLFKLLWASRGIYRLLNVLQLINLKKESVNAKYQSLKTSFILPYLNLLHSASNKLNIISDNSFFEWFRGLTDGEGCFEIIYQNSKFYFRFSIYMHKNTLSINNPSNLKYSKSHNSFKGYRSYSTYVKPNAENNIESDLNPWFVTGFADGESSFIILINKNEKYKTGYSIQGCFSINIHEKDRPTLEKIVKFFGVGNITKSGKQAIIYRVTSVKDLIKVIIPHFEKYKLLTQKQSDFLLFKQAVELMNEKKHLTNEGFEKILSIKSSLNLGITDDLNFTFPNIIPIRRPLVYYDINFDPYWVAGFTSGEGNFSVIILKSSSNKIGERVSLKFRITQHSRDTKLMKDFSSFFCCGYFYETYNRELGNFIVQNFKDINEKIIPFFAKFNIEGVKAEDFRDFCEIAKLVANKNHLTKEGLERIKTLKEKMNRGRISSSLGVNVYDEEGVLVYMFDSIKECGIFFGVSDRTINRRITNGNLVVYNNKNLIFCFST